MKRRHLYFCSIFLCFFTINSFAQSFESLKRSKGKSVLYAAVEGTLAGTKPVQECLQVISIGELTEPYNGKTPIYLVLDYLAKHPKTECGDAEQLLDAFVSRSDFNVHLRYGNLLPPLAYLIRENHSFLGGKFSKDYISDHVFQKLIEAGASVNTYNSEGESLMTFAIETGNEYLQTYFINHGVNLQHTDSEGNNAIHLAINKADVGLLNQMVSRGFKIDVHSFQNNTEEMRNKQPELYAFLANECSRHAETYDDIVLFQKKFSNKKTLVQQKYEALAQAEANNANDIKTINAVRSRYPDLGKITDSKKLSIYRKDVAEIERINREMVSFAILNKIYFHFPESGKVGEFLSEYKNYDPDNKLSMAQEILDFYFVCNVLAEREKWNNKKNDHYLSYTTIKKRGILGLLTDRYWDDGIVNRIRYRIDNAEKIMKTTSKHGYDSFYKNRLSEMDDVRAAFNRHIDRCYAEYRSSKSISYASSGSSSSSINNSSSSSNESSNENTENNVDVENIGMPNYEWTTDWALEGFLNDDPYNKKNEAGENQVRRIKFSGVRGTGRIKRVIGSDGYWTTKSKRYETLEDAIIAEYVNLKYGKVRKKGLK